MTEDTVHHPVILASYNDSNNNKYL